MSNSDIYIGVMSGTSLDGIDIAIVDFSKFKVIASAYYPYTLTFKNKIKAGHSQNELSVALGRLYAGCINDCIKKSDVDHKAIKAIGLHGQTVEHKPDGLYGFSLQLGDANIVAYQTGIITVADFRNKDICAGGQGAPLAPIFHQYAFKKPKQNTAVLNIGGIANITIFDDDKVLGFDIGPGNCLSDDWILKNLGKSIDKDGKWARSGKVNHELLNAMLNDDYLVKPAPKSTGREYFNLTWLDSFKVEKLRPEDVQSSIYDLVATTIDNALSHYQLDELLICGGGVHNTYLLELLQQKLQPLKVLSTAAKGYNPDFIEACAFAYLAKLTMEDKPGNLPEVTGAKEAVVLGAVYKP